MVSHGFLFDRIPIHRSPTPHHHQATTQDLGTKQSIPTDSPLPEMHQDDAYNTVLADIERNVIHKKKAPGTASGSETGATNQCIRAIACMDPMIPRSNRLNLSD